MPGHSMEVSRTLLFHFSPPNDLYILAATYPAGVPRHTNNTRAQVISAPLLAGDKNPRHANTRVTPDMQYN